VGEYDQYRAVSPCWYRGEVAFGAGQYVGASHPRLARWIAEGRVVSVAASSTRAVTGRLFVGCRVRARVGRVDNTGVQPFDVASWSQGASTTGQAFIDKPSGTVSGDQLLAIHTCDQTGNLTGLTAPDGSWSPVGTGGSSPSGYGKVWIKTAGGSEPDGYTFYGPAGGGSILSTDAFSGSGAWSSQWTTGQSTSGAFADHLSGEGRMYAGSLGGYAGRRSQVVNIADRADTSWLITVKLGAPEAFWGLVLRGDSTADRKDGYQIEVLTGSTNNVVLYRLTNYTRTSLATASVSVSAGTRYKVRFTVNGTSVTATVWAESGSEPGSPTVSATDSTHTSGTTYTILAGGNVAGAVAYLDDSEVSDPDVAASPPEQQVTVLRVTGASTTAPFQIDPVWSSSSTASTSHVASSLTLTGQALLVTGFHAVVNNRNTWTVPSGMTGAAALSTGGFTYGFASQDSTNWAGWSGNAAASGGQLAITPTTGNPGITYATTRTLLGAAVAVEAPTVPNVGNGGTYQALYFETSTNNRIQIMWANGLMRFRETVAGSNDDTTLTYNATDHRWWRVREAAGVVYWETSPDGTTWTTRRSKTTVLPLSSGTIGLMAGYTGTEPSPGAPKFDNVSLDTGIVASNLVSWQSFSAAGSTGTKTATSSVTSVASIGSMTVSMAMRLAGTEPPPPAGGMPSKVAGEWWHTWCPPNLADWPTDVIGSGTNAGLCNHVVALIAQSASSGTGSISWGPGDGTSTAAAAAAIAAVRARNVNVVLAIGGSDNGGVRINTSTHVTEMKASIATLRTQYGFNGIELMLKTGWTQAQVVTLYTDLKTLYGSTWVNGLWVDLYPPYTSTFLALIAALGSTNLQYVTLHLHDFPECRDSRLTTVTLRKIKQLVDAGWPASKILCFFMTRPPQYNWPNSSPLEVTRAAWIAAKAAYPDLLGATHYESRIEGGKTPSWPWMRDVGALIRA
jgi:hypothetical protein